jgi:hypothetical protein
MLVDMRSPIFKEIFAKKPPRNPNKKGNSMLLDEIPEYDMSFFLKRAEELGIKVMFVGDTHNFAPVPVEPNTWLRDIRKLHRERSRSEMFPPPPLVFERDPFSFDLLSKHFPTGPRLRDMASADDVSFSIRGMAEDQEHLANHDGDSLVIPQRLRKKAQYKHEGKFYANKAKKK